MSHGPRVHDANLNIRVPSTTLENIRKAAQRRGTSASELVRSAVSAATVTLSAEELVEHARRCGFDARAALVHACTVSDDFSLRAAAARLLAYGECEVPTGTAEEHGSVACAYLMDLGLRREHGGLRYHEPVDGVDWWTFFLD